MANQLQYKKDDNNTSQPTTLGTQSTGFIAPASGPQAPQTQNKTVGSGNFTNLQNYLNANKDVGTRIGATVGTKVNQELTENLNQSANATQQFGAANQDFQNTVDTGMGHVQGFRGNIRPANAVADGGPQSGGISTSSLMNLTPKPPQNTGGYIANPTVAPEQEQYTGPRPTVPTESLPPPGPKRTTQPAAKNAWDTSSYETTVPGQGYANDVGKDEGKTKEVQGIVTGETQAQKAQASEKAKQDAAARANEAQKNIEAKQTGTANEEGRFGLLRNYLGGKEYRSGLQSLDNAFLQKDSNDAIGKLKNEVQQKAQQFTDADKARIAEETRLGKNSANPDEVTGLYKAGNDVQKDLTGAITGISDEQAKQLDARTKAVNDAKVAQKASLENDVKNLTDNNDVSEDLWKTLGFDNLDSLKNPNGLFGSVARGYNEIDNLKSNYMDPTKALLNTQLLDEMAKDRYDVMNQKDIDNLSTLDKLLGRTKNDNYKVSKFGADQYGKGDVDLVKNINAANQAFGQEAVKNLEGFGNKQEGWGQGTVNFDNSVGHGASDVDAVANSSLARYLQGYGNHTTINDYSTGDNGGKDETGRSVDAAYKNANTNLDSLIKQKLAESGFGKTLTRAGKQSGTDNTKDAGKNMASGPGITTNTGNHYQDTTYKKSKR